eukprot:scaffold11830_cov139-Skeletonema_marinoi.AAC.1
MARAMGNAGMSNFFRPKRALYARARRKNGRRSSDMHKATTGESTTELICCCTYEISPTIFVHSGRTKGAIPRIRRDGGDPLTFRPSDCLLPVENGTHHIISTLNAQATPIHHDSKT